MNPSLLIAKLRSTQYEFLPAKIGLLAFAIGFLLYVLNNTLFKYDAIGSLICSRTGAVTFCGLLGLAGFVVMIRRELRQVVVIRGKLAMFYGLIWCVISWSLAIHYMFLLFSDISMLLK